MSIQTCTTFLHEILSSTELRQQMKAVTDTREIIELGRKYGYIFDMQDLIAASSSFNQESALHQPPPTEQKPAFYHYEYDMEQIRGFEEIVKELENLKIKPPTVDMERYEQSFRTDDFQFLSLSPADPAFEGRYKEIMQAHWEPSAEAHEFSRRDFHLVNLDQHINHPGYEAYLEAKTRMISLLEAFFGCEIRFSGSMWYPPFAYRLWHTNESQAGWRMYLIDFDTPSGGGRSFFRYMNPENKEIVTLEERPKIARFFKIEQAKEKLFWHCIANASMRNRWSFGFIVPDNWLERFPQQDNPI